MTIMRRARLAAAVGSIVLSWSCRALIGNAPGDGTTGDPRAGSDAASAGDPLSGDPGHADDGVASDPAAPGDAAVGDSAHPGDSATGDSALPGDAASGDPGPVGACGNLPGQLFPPAAAWNTPIDAAPLDAETDDVIAYLAANHTAAARFQIDFSLVLLTASAATPHRAFQPTGEFWSPDCDPAPPPLPPAGFLEGEDGYECTTAGDCHLMVIDWPECRLFEMWRANIVEPDFYGGCQAVWDLTVAPGPTGRGDYCTSADAAGLSIAAASFSADEVAAGVIDHAIRFILPNELIREDLYVHPATHSTGPTAGGPGAPPYGARLRLRASTDLSGLNAAAQVVARALKRYGMFLADGGNVTFTALSDRTTAHTWTEAGLGPHDLKSLSWTDFEMVDGGTRIDWTVGSCERTPITE
jgi:serine/threonine-protein kinase